ncbi:MAG: DUF342 domain-containing protein [Clostridiales bacterium]|nr:DUF342 domain-containing protein [Clostridiales bacterium]
MDENISKNESIDLDISADKMSVSIIFTEPINNGSLLTKSDIVRSLNGNGIRYGIDENLIDELLANKEYGRWFKVAEGEEPQKGVDGYIEYFFTTDKKSLKPKMLDDGSVDYKNMNLFETAVENQTLAISHPAVPGKDGMNVFAKSIPAERPKKAPALPKGKNTKILEDGVTLISEISGRIFYMDGRVSVFPILEIMGDVDNSTGNVEFLGTIVVKGTVLSGFSVNAGADVEIEGAVEGAIIKAKGNVLLMKGVQGGGKAVIEAGGDINANFIESSTVSAGGNITANSIMHSKVRCGNILNLVGKRGLFVGGKAVVGSKIEAKVIGSNMATVTELEVGVDPVQLEEYKQAVQNIEKYNEQYKETEKVINIIQRVELTKLTDEKKKMLMDAIRNKIVLKSKINENQQKVETIMPRLKQKNGRVSASNVIYSGVKVTINDAVMYVRDDLQHCSLINNKGKVSVGAL